MRPLQARCHLGLGTLYRRVAADEASAELPRHRHAPRDGDDVLAAGGRGRAGRDILSLSDTPPPRRAGVRRDRLAPAMPIKLQTTSKPSAVAASASPSVREPFFRDADGLVRSTTPTAPTSASSPRTRSS